MLICRVDRCSRKIVAFIRVPSETSHTKARFSFCCCCCCCCCKFLFFFPSFHAQSRLSSSAPTIGRESLSAVPHHLASQVSSQAKYPHQNIRSARSFSRMTRFRNRRRNRDILHRSDRIDSIHSLFFEPFFSVPNGANRLRLERHSTSPYPVST